MSAEDYVAGGRRLGDVPRTTEAADAGSVARRVSRRLGPPAAWWGMLILIATEGTLLTAMIASYYYLRFHTAAWPPAGDPRPDLGVPLVLSVVLALTSVPMQLASFAAHGGRVAATRTLLLGALVVQAAYLAYQAYDYHDQLRRTHVGRDAYTSIYYTLLGVDHAHVALGILFVLWLLWKLRRGLTTYRMNATLAICWYWHFVNLFTLLITATILTARL